MKRLLEYTPFLRKRGILPLFLIPLFFRIWGSPSEPHFGVSQTNVSVTLRCRILLLLIIDRFRTITGVRKAMIVLLPS